MPADGLLTIFSLMAQKESAGVEHGLLCDVAAEFIGLSGAGIAVASSDVPLTSFCASGEASSALMDLEITVGEGPCSTAHVSEIGVGESDLRQSRDPRWPLYTPIAVGIGARAVFGFPVRMGAVRLGALGLYREAPGELAAAQRGDGYLVASVIGRAILAVQAGAGPGSLSSELQRESMFDFSVHQAAGIVAGQGSMSLGDALIAMRMHASATGTALSELSARIIAHEVRYGSPEQSWSNDPG